MRYSARWHSSPSCCHTPHTHIMFSAWTRAQTSTNVAFQRRQRVGNLIVPTRKNATKRLFELEFQVGFLNPVFPGFSYFTSPENWHYLREVFEYADNFTDEKMSQRSSDCLTNKWSLRNAVQHLQNTQHQKFSYKCSALLYIQATSGLGWGSY